MNIEEQSGINMQLIAFAGSAKSCFVEAVDEALDGNITEAEKLMAEGKESFTQAHQAHFKLLQEAAKGELEVDLLSVHAQCQLMSAEDMQLIAEKVIARLKK